MPDLIAESACMYVYVKHLMHLHMSDAGSSKHASGAGIRIMLVIVQEGKVLHRLDVHL